MNKRKLWLTTLFLTAGLSVSASSATMAANAKEGSLAFARCDEYINVRSEANTDSEVVAKLYNNGSAVIKKVLDDGWYEIQSGDITGYVSSDYMVTGKKAKKVAKKVAYNVAVVYPEALNIRTAPSSEAGILDVATSSQELEVVAKDDAWMTVALGNDKYGFVDASYCGYKTYYPLAVPVGENGYAAAEEDNSITEVSAPSDAHEETENTAESEVMAEEVSVEHTDSDTMEWGAVSDESYSQEEAVTEDDQDTTGEYSDINSENTYGEPSDDTNYDDSYGYDNGYDDSYDESYDNSYDNSYDDSYDESYTDSAETAEGESSSEYEGGYDYSDTGSDDYVSNDEVVSSDGALGQAIADYALQFVGNPYVYGGTSLTNGADCSGFTMSVLAAQGIGIARTAAGQAGGGTPVSLDAIQPGDLLFYSEGGGISHVAIYIGGGAIVHAATEDQGICVSDAYYSTPVSAARYW
ncbi:MAG: NlpC/P60 family protein [Muricoprocola sp.]